MTGTMASDETHSGADICRNRPDGRRHRTQVSNESHSSTPIAVADTARWPARATKRRARGQRPSPWPTRPRNHGQPRHE